MQISHFAVEELKSNELRAPAERPPGTYSFVVCVPPTPPDSSGTGCCSVFVNIGMGSLGTPEGRAQISGNPQWPWMAIQLTSKQETSSAVIIEKWNLLWAGVRSNIRLGLLSLDPEFQEPPAFGLSEAVCIDPHQMDRWYAALKSIDFWYPMLVPNPSECLFSKYVLSLQMAQNVKPSPDGDSPYNDSKSTIPLPPRN
jgi:hypothetical protein